MSVLVFSSPLRVGTITNSDSEIANFVNNLDKTLEIKIINYDNQELLNNALVGKKIDLGMFQTKDSLNEYNKRKKENLIVLEEMYIDSIGIYSLKYGTIKGINQGAAIIIPKGISNEKRALEFLEKLGLIQLNPIREKTTVRNVIANPFNLDIIPIDLKLLPRYLEVADYVVLDRETSMNIGYNPIEDSLGLEEFQRKYINVLVARDQMRNNKKVIRFSKLVKNKETKLFIMMKYGNNIRFIP